MINPTSFSENGSPTRYISSRQPKHKLHEVRYACHVGMPSILCEPSAFGMYARRTGGAR
jgi:hypothetical protein